MNYDRYTVPVIVAATIHAALLIWNPPQIGASLTPPVRVPQIKPPPTIIEVTLARAGDPDEPYSFRSGKPAPQTPEILRPVVEDAVFELPPTQTEDHAPAHQTDLPANPLGGPGDGPGHWGVPGLPSPVPAGLLDHTPRARVQPAPLYPAALRASGTEGRVVVEFTVDTQGRVTSATVLNSTQREFEDETIRAVMKWRFEPGRRNGRAVPFRMTVPLEFRLSDGA